MGSLGMSHQKQNAISIRFSSRNSSLKCFLLNRLLPVGVARPVLEVEADLPQHVRGEPRELHLVRLLLRERGGAVEHGLEVQVDCRIFSNHCF